MCSDYEELYVRDNLPDFGEVVLEEEITLLAPHFNKRLAGALGQTDDGGKPNNQSGALRQGQHRKAG